MDSWNSVWAYAFGGHLAVFERIDFLAQMAFAEGIWAVPCASAPGTNRVDDEFKYRKKIG